MPSPFPGMDPYLEDPAGWPDFHHHLIDAISAQLANLISPHFHVRVEERIYLTSKAGDDPGFPQLVPDLIVTKGQYDPNRKVSLPSGALVVSPVEIEELFDMEIHDYYIEVRDARSKEVVTAIELLSPANKVNGAKGRDAMLAKKKLLLSAGAHWMEIDLLRAGERDERLADKSDYCITLARPRPGFAPQVVAWFVDLRDPLPVVGVPLRKPFADAPLDLQAALNDAYDRAHYADSIDYTHFPPIPRLTLTDGAWVRRTIEEWLEMRAKAV